MTRHLAEIARRVDDGVQAVLTMNQACWHMSANLVVPDNISILSLQLIRLLAEFDSWASQNAMNQNLCCKLEVSHGSSDFIADGF